MADLVVKTGVGLSVGVALSVILFKRASAFSPFTTPRLRAMTVQR